MATIRKLIRMPKLVGYSLAGFVSTAIVSFFFWFLESFYDITLIVDSDTNYKVESFFDVLFLIFFAVLGFTIFPVLLFFFLRGLKLLCKRFKTLGKSFLKNIIKKEKKIIYNGAIAYWFLYIMFLAIYFFVYFNKYINIYD